MKLTCIFILFPLIFFSQGIDSVLTASPAEQLLFSLNFSKMNYCCSEVMVQRKEIADRDTMLALYGRKTGILATNVELMEKNFNLQQNLCKECVPKLTECESSLLKFQTRCKRRGWTIAIGIPLSIGVGFATGVIYQSLK